MGKKYSLGIGLNLFDAEAILLSQDNQVITRVKKNRVKVSANETLTTLIELFEEILSKAKKHKSDIEGIGLALGGIVNSKKGIVYWPQPPDSYVALPLRDYFKKKFGFPVYLENDANASAWAEYQTNFSKCNNVIYLFSGVGCGIIINGGVYKGRDGAAGELFLNPQKNMSSYLGDFSFLSRWPADLGMVKRAKALVSLGKETRLIKRISSSGELSLGAIFEEAKKKDKISREVVREAAQALGAKSAFLINLLNPEVLIIGGGLEVAGEFFLEGCFDSLKKFSFSEMRKNCKVTLSGLGSQATSLGAAMLVFKEKALQV
ncbi:MAG: ROK family protein [Candidatus Omnitrophica bacterium]|nr:ROK family protein [Candidatus Omnitrophota bacterium]MBU2251328.1 ROK family protein [Candidatus Omnitrophota bacterium]MBU2265476.1 ROK family protein [Candidatus Omnitrophota bacterium]